MKKPTYLTPDNNNHLLVDAADFFAAMERSKVRAEAMRAEREG